MAQKKRRSKLEKVLHDNSELTYETTIEDCQRWFNLLNREIFDNTLPPIQIDIRWRRNAYAWYDYNETRYDPDTAKLLMNKRYKSKQFFVEVMAHEMIHHYQYVYGERMGHGLSFEKWRGKFNKKGLSLFRAY